MDTQLTTTPPAPLQLMDTALVPALFAGAGEQAGYRFIEYFTARIRNPHTRQAYFRAVNRFSQWCMLHNLELTTLNPVVIAGYIEELQGELGVTSVKQHLSAIRMLFDYLVTGQVVPFTTQAPVGSTDPLDLYAWLENYEATTGGSALAIAHNGNLSNGLMFPVDAQYTGRAIDAAYVESRAKWEPLYETTQIKGDGEAHPFLSPDDAFADYETWDVGNLDLTQAKTPEMLQYEYTREALKNGLLLESRLGTNPYKFGLVGSTDSHTALSAVEEDNFFGKASNAEPKPERMQHPFTETEVGVFEGYQLVASGYTGVWARENTRAAIWDAMDRKEVYATTGPRMLVRFFGGWDYTDQDLNSRQPAFRGYEKGVPMGGDLPVATGEGGAPSFMVYALRDPVGANLDRIQIVKGWLDAEGATHERVHDVAWSPGREPDAEGALPPVGSTVDVAAANWTNTIGAAELAAVWSDPDFDPAQPAFYYARVLEIPTPRWVVYDAFRFGVPIPEGAETEAQERAYTSPIWYQPEG